MAKKKTTPKERREFIQQQRANERAVALERGGPKGLYDYLSGKGYHTPTGDMSFIDREGNIVHPSREEYEAARKYRSKRRYLGILAIIGLLGAIFFLSHNLTGNAIVNIRQGSSNWLGAFLLIVGLVGAFFWIKKE